MVTPTAEQQAIVDAFGTGESLVIEAGAGAGKTSTLKMLGRSNPARSGIYIAYNRAIAADAKADFPRNVSCSTAHSLAFRSVGHRYSDRLNGPRLPARVMADYLGLKKETAHKAKGREWETVRIAGDFRKDKVSREEAMLAYVAVTRAKLVLDREGLAWVDSLAKAPAGAA